MSIPQEQAGQDAQVEGAGGEDQTEEAAPHHHLQVGNNTKVLNYSKEEGS